MAAISFASCGNKAENNETTDSVAQDTVQVEDTASQDSVPGDTVK